MWNKLNNKKWKIKNKILGLCLVSYISSVQAEVLIILPESGPLTRAASSIKQGFLSAYATSGQKVPLKWVNSNQKNISQLLKFMELLLFTVDFLWKQRENIILVYV